MSDDLLPRFAGIMTSRGLNAAGYSPAQIRRLTRQGVLAPVNRGAYAHAALAAGTARDPAAEQALRVASVLAVGTPCAVGSHLSAAIIHGLDVLGPAPRRTLAVTHPPGTGSGAGRPGVRVHVAALPDGHVTVQGGVRVTTVARTVVDVARASSFRAGVVTADSALRAGKTSKAELQAVIADCRRWPGIVQAKLVAAFSDGRSESALESIARVAFGDHGLPAPELQVWVGGERAGVIGRADFFWRRHATIGEADGAVKYQDPARAVAQLRRDASLRAAGFEVVHFTWQEIVHAPSQVAALIRAAFRRAEAR